MYQKQSKFRFALVSHSIEVVNIVRKHVDPASEDLFATLVGLDDAVPTAEALIREGYEVILGHGGTGGMIAKSVGQPVVTIPINMLDIVTAVLKAETFGDRIGITSLAEGREGFDSIRNVLGVDVREIVFNSQNELQEGVEKAIEEGVNVIVGGGVSRKIANRLQVRAVIIEPGEQIVKEALGQARALVAARRIEMEHHERLQTILKIMDDGMICVDADGHLTSYNQNVEAMLGMDLGPHMGQSVSDFAGALGLMDVLKFESKKSDEIINFQGNEIIVNSLPILINEKVCGAVSLLKEGSAIHGMDRKLRERIYKKGFIAKYRMTDIVASSPSMRSLIARAKKFARTEASIFVSGETGTGKEFLTHAIHNYSHRKKAPFVAVNCAALSETLLESELFGHEEGAFTGAKKGGKIGLFELANHGTIFLDEIGDISSNLQIRLLRVLENREVMRVGGDKIVPVDVRIISSTHRNLLEAVRAGHFRKDLYYRLAVLRLAIPPLRQRLQDIPELLAPLLSSYAKSLSCLTPEMLALMHAYHWPGNIRELNALMESYLILLGRRKGDERLFTELFEEYRDPVDSSRPKTFVENDRGALPGLWETGGERSDRTLSAHLERHKQNIIHHVLHQCGHNKTLTAKRLGISTNTLWRALKGKEKTTSKSR